MKERTATTVLTTFLLFLIASAWLAATNAHGGMLLTKLDSGGEVLWSMDNEDEKYCDVVALDENANVYLGCSEHFHKFDSNGEELWKYSEAPTDFLNVDREGNSYFVCGDYCVAKRSSDNQLVWETTFNDADVFSVSLCPDGGLLVDAFVLDENDVETDLEIMLSADGDELWRTSATDLMNEEKYYFDHTLIGGDGSIYVIAWTYASDELVTIFKLDNNGLLQWTRTLVGNSWSLFLRPDDQGYAYIVLDGGVEDYSLIKLDSLGSEEWRTSANWSGTWYPDGAVLTDDQRLAVGATLDDYSGIRVSSFSPEGTQLWSSAYIEDFAASQFVAADSQGNIILAGYQCTEFEDEMGGCALLTFKFDADGNQLWSNRVSSPNGYGEEVTDLAVDEDDSIYVLGFYQDQRDEEEESGCGC